MFLTGRVRGPIRVKWLIGWLLLSENDEQRRRELVGQLLDRAADLSTRLRILNWFGTDPESSSRDPDAEILDAQTTARLITDLVERVTEAEPQALAGEPSLRFILAVVAAHDEARGRELVAEKASDDQLMIALLRAHYSTTASVTAGEAAIRQAPQLAWKTLAELVGEDLLRQRLHELRGRLEEEGMDADTKAALERAVDISEGRADAVWEL